MDCFLDIQDVNLTRTGEELCGDKAKVVRTPEKTIVVLSDGLGNGVKANILATLTSEILVTMLKAEVPLEEVMKTVVGTLPVCKIRKVAYASFTVVVIDHHDHSFQIMNLDNPPALYIQGGRLVEMQREPRKVLDRVIRFSYGVLGEGDFLGLITDGVENAGIGGARAFGWGWVSVGAHLEALFQGPVATAREVADQVIDETSSLYGERVGDDATFVGIYRRQLRALTVLSGPPLERAQDEEHVRGFLEARGRRVVCGGTTGNMVARFMGTEIETDLSTIRHDIPPVGTLPGVDLVTEGILTMGRCLELLREAGGDARLLPDDRNGAVLLARELLRADSVLFLVGQRVNQFYQNPLLPRQVSIRKKLVEELGGVLAQLNKEVRFEYC